MATKLVPVKQIYIVVHIERMIRVSKDSLSPQSTPS